MTLSRTASRLRRLLAAKCLPLAVGLLAVVLASPGLGAGLQVDDFYLQMALARPPVAPEWSRTPFNVFAFFAGDPGFVRDAADWGAVPWWTQQNLRLAFFRPLTGLTHWADFRLWPAHPWLMHLQSLVWFGAAVVAAAVLYRRLLRPAWVAGLAALLFALDDAHGWPAVWIANRNANIAVLFSVLAIFAYDTARRRGRRLDVVAPLFLLLGLLSGEMAVGALGYLIAYAVFLDRDRLANRFVSLLPCMAVTAAWAMAYRAHGYGAVGSMIYIDPGAQPLAFAAAVLERVPILLFGQFLLPSELHLLLSEPARRIFWIAGCLAAGGAAVLFAPLVRRDPVSRFLAAGMLLALVPACATFPADRLLYLVGFGAMGLLAQWFAEVAERAPRHQASRLRRVALGTAWVVLLVVHGVLAPLQLLATGHNLQPMGAVTGRAARSFREAVTGREARVLIVNTPTAFVSAYGPLQMTLGGNVPPRTLALASGIYATELRRVDRRVLIVRPELGFFPPPGAIPPGRREEAAAFDLRYLFMVFDRLYRDTPMTAGMRVVLTEVTVEVTEVTADGRPAEVAYRFDRDLDDPRYRWLQWEDGVYAPFAVPEVGESLTLPPVVVPMFGR